MWPIFPKFTKIRWIRGDSNLKFTHFTAHKFEMFEKIKHSEKYVKKPDKILRLLVKKIFQINNICIVKI
jgi:hypothetical protein